MIELDRALRRWADVVERETKTDHRTAAGAGAAGGVGFYALSDLEPDRARSMSQAAELLAAVSEKLARSLSC